jgi:hypothetical protein
MRNYLEDVDGDRYGEGVVMTPKSLVKPLVVNDAEVDVEAPRRIVGKGIVDDGGDVVRSSPTPLG